MHRPETYKVQIDATESKLLVYNKDRSATFQGPKPPALDLPALSKRYARGFINEEGQIEIFKFLPDGWTEAW